MGTCCSTKKKRRRRKRSEIIPTYRTEEEEEEKEEEEKREKANPFDRVVKEEEKKTEITIKTKRERQESFIERLKRERRKEIERNNTIINKNIKKETMASYQHDKLNYQFEYPKTWKIDNVPKKNTVFILSPTEQLTSFQDHIAINIHFSAKNAKTYIKELQEQMEFAPKYEELKRIKKTSMKHLKGYTFKCQYTLGNNKRELIQKTVVCEGGDSLLYIFTYASDNGYHSAKYLFNILSEGIYFQYKDIPMTCIKTPNIHLYFPPYWKGKGAVMMSPIDTEKRPERVVIQKQLKENIKKDYELRGEEVLKTLHCYESKTFQLTQEDQQINQEQQINQQEEEEEENISTTTTTTEEKKKEEEKEETNKKNTTTTEEIIEKEKTEEINKETINILLFTKIKLLEEYKEKYDIQKVQKGYKICKIDNKPAIFFELAYKRREKETITPFLNDNQQQEEKKQEENKDTRVIIHQPVFSVIANKNIWTFQYQSANKKISARLFRNMMEKFVLTETA